MKKTSLLVVAALLCTFYIQAQDVILENNVRDIRDEKPDEGPGRDKFGHFHLGLGFAASPPEGNGLEVEYGFSHSFHFGYLRKYRLAGPLEAGFGIVYFYEHFRIKQNDEKLLPDGNKHDKETLKFDNLDANLFLRMRIGKSGNNVGKFIDAGGYGGWVFTALHETEDEDVIPNAGLTTSIHSDLKYANAINYGAMLRVGFNRWALNVRYRLSDYLDDTLEKANPNADARLPRLSVGLQWGVHK